MFPKLNKNVLNISALDDRPSMSAAELKAFFDRAGADIKAYLNDLVEQIAQSTAGEHIGVDVSSVATKTLQAVLTSFDESISNRYTKTETDTALSQNTNNLLSDLDVNLTTGVITVTRKDGTKETFDTALEKIPAKFEIVEENEVYYLRITNTDGTKTQVNVNTLFNEYLFTNSDEISFEIVAEGNSKKVIAKLRDNSIGITKLSLDVVTQLQEYVNSAKDSADSARNSEQNASSSAEIATQKATSASASANSAKTNAESATESASSADANAKLSKSYAVGGTGTREGEDTDNAKYYARQAQEAAGGDFLPKTGDSSNTTVTFTEFEEKTDIESGDKLSTLFGKIKKWFGSLANVAFSGSYNDLKDVVEEVFIATYNVTTYAEIQNAVNTGKVILLDYGGTHRLQLTFISAEQFNFAGYVDAGTILYNAICKSTNKWTLEAKNNTIPTNTSQLTNDSNYISSTVITAFWKGTQAEYDALGTYDDTTLYLIKKEE